MTLNDTSEAIRTVATTGRPMRKDAARNRELLVEAAREVFARRGLEASLDDIARQAGVGIGTAYRHFGNKYDLAAAVMQDSIADVVLRAVQAAESDDPWTGLVGFLEAVLALQTRDRGLREVMLGVHDRQSTVEVHDQLAGPVGLILRRCQDAGQVRTDAAMSDLGFVVLMLCQVADVAGDSGPLLWRRYLPTLLAGLRPDGPALEGAPMADETFRTASAHYKTCRLRATGATPPT